MANLTDELALIEGQLADKDTYDTLPKEELDALLTRSAKKRSRLTQVEEDWLQASERLEQSD